MAVIKRFSKEDYDKVVTQIQTKQTGVNTSELTEALATAMGVQQEAFKEALAAVVANTAPANPDAPVAPADDTKVAKKK